MKTGLFVYIIKSRGVKRKIVPNEKSPKNQGLQWADIESVPTFFITN